MTIHKLYRPNGPAVWTRAEGWSVPKPLPPHIVAILSERVSTAPVKAAMRCPPINSDRGTPNADD